MTVFLYRSQLASLDYCMHLVESQQIAHLLQQSLSLAER